LGSNPDSDGSGKISAQEAFNYSDSIHDPYDTPVYNQSSASAGNCYLGQRYLVWWWWCRIILEHLEPVYMRRSTPEFYEIMHEKLVPQLEKLEIALNKDSEQMRKKMETSVKEIIAKVYK